jgi:hypothetical protein
MDHQNLRGPARHGRRRDVRRLPNATRTANQNPNPNTCRAKASSAWGQWLSCSVPSSAAGWLAVTSTANFRRQCFGGGENQGKKGEISHSLVLAPAMCRGFFQAASEALRSWQSPHDASSHTSATSSSLKRRRTRSIASTRCKKISRRECSIAPAAVITRPICRSVKAIMARNMPLTSGLSNTNETSSGKKAPAGQAEGDTKAAGGLRQRRALRPCSARRLSQTLIGDVCMRGIAHEADRR